MSLWLVTGGSGFLGRPVLEALRARGLDPWALGRRVPAGWPSERFARADLEDREGLARVLASLRPDVVVHAAGRTPPAPAPLLYRANVGGTANLLGALASTGRAARVVVSGSAAELGPVPAELLPVDESCPCRPADAYGLSKWAASRLARTAGGALEVMVGRVFNPIGPALPTSQAFGRFAGLLAAGGPGPLTLRVGGLSARRDFVDVRDAAEALVALGMCGRAGRFYHIGTGLSRTVGEGLAVLVALSGREVIVEPSGPSRGPSDSRADIRRIAGETGWRPQRSFESSLADLWRTQNDASGAGRAA